MPPTRGQTGITMSLPVYILSDPNICVGIRQNQYEHQPALKCQVAVRKIRSQATGDVIPPAPGFKIFVDYCGQFTRIGNIPVRGEATFAGGWPD